MSETGSLRNRSNLKRKPDNSAVKQQRLPGVHPKINAWTVASVSFVLAAACITLGAFIIKESNSIQTYDIDYTDCTARTFFQKADYDLHNDPEVFSKKLAENANWMIENNLQTCVELYKFWLADQVSENSQFISDSPPTCICTAELNIETEITRTSYLYYKLDNFYQNHRRMLKSKDAIQLLAKSKDDIENPDKKCYINGPTDSTKADFPCGAIANSMFNDTFFLYTTWSDDELYDKVSQPHVGAIETHGEGISWITDRVQKYDADHLVENMIKENNYNLNVNTPPNWQFGVETLGTSDDLYYRYLSGSNGLGLKNEDFIVWMRTPAYVNFKKLYRLIETPLSAGNVTVLIFYNFNVVNFDGKKSIVIGTTSWAGGNNFVLGCIYCVTGSLAAVLCVIASICQNKY